MLRKNSTVKEALYFERVLIYADANLIIKKIKGKT